MNTFTNFTRRAFFCAAITCLGLGSATTAFAVPVKQVLNITRNQTLTGICCFAWNLERVSVQEPAKVQAVVVTFETDFELTSFEAFAIGLMVNDDGVCQTGLGPFFLNEAPHDALSFLVGSVEWVVLPSDGLHPGTNTFTVCGGGPKSTSQITLGFNSLAARISK